ncbi:MAG: hypothetical protein JNJ90_15605 [Saprospiraceae bacterium]|jgi:hypothetical protein|nr:hypothetical protein [Saprospiraceae bacterium]
MQSPSAPKHIPYRNIQKGTSSAEYVDKLITFLKSVLPTFPQEKRLKKEQSENDLTEELYKFLTRKARLDSYPFEFQPEKAQKMPKGHAKRVDLAARVLTKDIDMEVIYCLEAKKLPTDRPGGEREMEYVLGRTGGIERFKNEAHGKDDEGNLLPRNGIVGYITANDFVHWHTQVNSWILAAGWSGYETLILNYSSEIGVLTSNHFRISGDVLLLTHFWVKI